MASSNAMLIEVADKLVEDGWHKTDGHLLANLEA